MPNDDRKPQETPDQPHPIDPPPADDERYRLDGDRTSRDNAGGDAGKTSGGGSLGHIQPDRVEREAPLRNNAEKRDDDEPTMPSRQSSVNTKI